MELGIDVKTIFNEILKFVLLIVISSLIIFSLVSLSPIDPLTSNYSQSLTSKMSESKIEDLQNYWGVGKPFFERFASWLSNVMQGNLGDSLVYNEPVLDVILRGLKNSAPIMLVSWVLSGAFGFLGAVFVSNRKNKASKCLKLINYCLVSTPTYFVAILFLLIFSVTLNVFTVTSTSNFQSSILPCIVLILFGAPTIFFHTLSKCEETNDSDFVKQARISGLNQKEITKKHVLRNVSLPFLSIEFAQIGEIIGGSVVVEQVFSYPGLGSITIKAATSSDVCLIAGISFVTCVIVFLGNLICKAIVVKIDPRVQTIR